MSSFLILLAFGSGAAMGQTPDLRKVAATGPDYPDLDEQPVWETRIAAGSSRIIAVYNLGPRGSSVDPVTRIGYAIAQQSGGAWTWTTQGIIPNVLDYANGLAIDPDIAYDATANDFLACGIIGFEEGETDYTRLAFARYASHSGAFAAGWQTISGTEDEYVDYPKIVAGRELSTQSGAKREFWITYHRHGGGLSNILFYRRSADGGLTWSGGEVLIGGNTVPGTFAHPAVAADGTLYVAYVLSSGSTGFLRGDVSGSTVTFSHLTDGTNPVTLTPESTNFSGATPLIPTQFNLSLWTQANLAPDPSDPNIIHMVYNDLVEASPSGEKDVDVFYRRLTQSGSGTWSLGSRIRVNNVDPNDVDDQFRPYIVATPKEGDDSRLHVVFYDDSRFSQDDWTQQQTTPAKVDIYYAYSTDGGDSWDNQQIYLTSTPSTDPPALDYSVPLHTNFQLGEYGGISVRPSGDDWEIWGSFIQTLPANPPVETESDFSQVGAVRVPFSGSF